MAKYTLIWRNKFLTTKAKTVEEMGEILCSGGQVLLEMAGEGVKLVGGQEDDYACLTTDDPEVAGRFGMTPEPEID